MRDAGLGEATRARTGRKNYGGPHLSQANACPEKRRVRKEARGGDRPPPSGRLRSRTRSPRKRQQRGRR